MRSIFSRVGSGFLNLTLGVRDRWKALQHKDKQIRRCCAGEHRRHHGHAAGARLGGRRGFPCLGNQAQCSLHTRSLSRQTGTRTAATRMKTPTAWIRKRQQASDSMHAAGKAPAKRNRTCARASLRPHRPPSELCGGRWRPTTRRHRPPPPPRAAAATAAATDRLQRLAGLLCGGRWRPTTRPRLSCHRPLPRPQPGHAHPQQPRPRLPGQAGMQTLWRPACLSPSAGS